MASKRPGEQLQAELAKRMAMQGNNGPAAAPAPTTPGAPPGMTPEQIKAMIENTKRQLEARKAQLGLSGNAPAAAPVMPGGGGAPRPGLPTTMAPIGYDLGCVAAADDGGVERASAHGSVRAACAMARA